MKIILFFVNFLFAGIIIGKDRNHFKKPYRDFIWLATAIENCMDQRYDFIVSGLYEKIHEKFLKILTKKDAVKDQMCNTIYQLSDEWGALNFNRN